MKRNAMSLVSIIIPVHNRTLLLGRTLQSVLDQSFADWEMIVVDDGSSEDVQEYLSHFPDPRIRSIRQENRGNAAARNTGFQQSSGEFVAFLDSDDLWHPAALEKMLAVMASHPDVDVVYSRFVCIDADGNLIERKKGPLPVKGDVLEAMLLGHPIPPSTALIRRRAFENWGGFTPGLDDWELWLRWAARGCRFEGIGEPYVSYRMHAQNLNLDWDKRLQTHLAMLHAFYALDVVPPVAIQRRRQVYARQHFHFAVLAWQVGRPGDGLKQFIQAAREWPDYLGDLDFFTQIACAHQDWVERGSPVGFNYETGRETLIGSLDALFSEPSLSEAVRSRRPSAYAWAHFALARLAYGHLQDMGIARNQLFLCLASWPVVAFKSDWFIWWMRSIVGIKHIRAIKRQFRLSSPAVPSMVNDA